MDHYEFYYEAPSEVNNICTHKQEYSYNKKLVEECFLLNGATSCNAKSHCWFNGKAPVLDTPEEKVKY